MVKGLRANKDRRNQYINQCVQEIKNEIKKDDRDIKSQAVLKLAHLYMLGTQTDWANFHVIEVMSYPQFGYRRVGYLAASLFFRKDVDVLVLTTHLFKKAFGNQSAKFSQYDTGCAINCLANVVNEDLAQNLLSDVFGLVNSSSPYVRKKSVLVLYKVFEVWPQALRLAFPRIREKIQDSDIGVRTSAINVICELAKKNPKNYLAVVPALFELLNSSGNNWMLIKLVKLMGSLIMVEPRLASKLKEPLSNIISTTPAKSLLYECINTATSSPRASKQLLRLSLDKLRLFIEDRDQNLRYLGLLGLKKIMNQQPKSVAQHRDTILACLEDTDITIRMRALDLITSMVTRRNLQSIVSRLQDHLASADGSYREHIMEQIIKICKEDDYSMIEDFRWYIRLLAKMIHEPGIRHAVATLISDQLIDVTVRVPGIRDFAVAEMERVFLEGRVSKVHSQNASLARILYAAGYIVGEFSQHVNDYIEVAKALMNWQMGASTNTEQAPFIQSALKVVLRGLGTILQEGRWDGVEEWKEFAVELLETVIKPLEDFSESNDLEVQERACSYLFILNWVQGELENRDHDEFLEIVEGCQEMFETQLIPVDPNAQKSVPIPKGIDLDEWVYEPPEVEDSDSDEPDFDADFDVRDLDTKEDLSIEPAMPDPSEIEEKSRKKKKKTKAQMKKQRREQEARKEADPYYLTGGDYGKSKEEDEIDDIPIESISFNDEGVKLKPRKAKKAKNKAGILGVVGPKGKKTKKSKTKKFVADMNDPLANIDLSGPLREDEIVPEIKPYERQTADDFPNKDETKRKRKKDKKKEKKKKERKRKRKKAKDEGAENDEEDKVQTEATVTNDLLDFGVDFGMSSSSPAQASSQATSSSNPLDLFNDLGSSAPAKSASQPKEKSSKRKSKPSGTSLADGKISIKFDFKSSSRAESSSLTMNIVVQNTSDEPMKGVTLQMSSGSCLRPAKKKVLLAKKLKPGSKEKCKSGLKCTEAFGEDQVLKFTLKAKTADGDISTEGTCTVPVNRVLIKSTTSMTYDQFKELLTSEDEGLDEKATTTLEDVSFDVLIERLEDFGFLLVETRKQKMAAFFSDVIGGRQCALYVKKGESGFHINLKAETAEFAEGLLSTIESLF